MGSGTVQVGASEEQTWGYIGWEGKQAAGGLTGPDTFCIWNQKTALPQTSWTRAPSGGDSHAEDTGSKCPGGGGGQCSQQEQVRGQGCAGGRSAVLSSRTFTFGVYSCC